jgi:hypothetical protein
MLLIAYQDPASREAESPTFIQNSGHSVENFSK